MEPKHPETDHLQNMVSSQADRLQMAEQRLEKADIRFKETEQHYYSLVSGRQLDSSVLRLGISEVFSHLRPVLDYCACELRDRYSTPGHRRIQTSFPIATINDDQKAFKKSVDQNIPGLVANHPAIFVLLESFQFYSSANNRWLPEFRILTNGDKHEKLSLISGLVGRGRMLEPYLGRPVYEIDAAGRTIEELMHGSCALIPRTEPDGYEFAAAWVRFEETGRSVDGFLRRALIGVRQILESLKPYISQSSGCT